MPNPADAGADPGGKPGRRGPWARRLVPPALVGASVLIACLMATPRCARVEGALDDAGLDDSGGSPGELARIDDYVRRFRRAQQLFGSGRDAEAESEFRALLAIHPDAAAVHHALASLEWLRGRQADALEGFRTAARLAPKDGAIRRDCGLRLTDTGHAAEALPHLEAARALLDPDVETVCAWGRGLLATGRPADAEAAWREALSIDSNSVDARSLLARHLAAVRPEESLALLDPVPPNWPDVVEGRALALERLARWDEAAEAWRRLAAMGESMKAAGGPALQSASEGLVRSGDAEGAAAASATWAGIDRTGGNPSLRATVCLATARAGAGDEAGALAALDASPVSAKAPAGVVAHLGLVRAHLLVAISRPDEARTVLGTVTELDAPFERAAARFLLGREPLSAVTDAAKGAALRANDIAWIEWLAARFAGDAAGAAAAATRAASLTRPPGEHPGLLLRGAAGK